MKIVCKEREDIGQNENDVLKLAHQIFFNNHKKKFLLEHAWKELRNDQKWCEVSSAKNEGISKKRKCEDGGDSSTSQADSKKRPGVKASKASGKKTVDQEKQVKDHLFYDTDVPVLLFCTLVSREWMLGQEQERVERQTRPRESGALYCLVLFYHGSLYLVTGLVLLHCIVFGHGSL
ncbi:hypothetical protein F2Q69_00020957 [Brassica cretica]|uniref:No apical meristem-associated C-terminal domain-containing protein n=1 Tax=Brassica cretica TaxID=69181 RepID=A0A8S9QQ15_BRACR|nr:hypothetical protein F2Q69_00020957 [Brassica cretica]